MPGIKFHVGSVVALAASILSAPAGAQVTGPLVVPDTANNRVLIYNSPATDDQPADVVLGQSSFVTSSSGTSSSTMSGPTSYTLDSSGNLYVSDSGNCRVLVFPPPFTDGEDATVVIGQPDANTGCGAAASASTLGTTGGVAFGTHGNFWVVDEGNSRILKFLAPLTTGMAAKLVIGQTDFVSSGCPQPPTAASLCSPVGIAVDSGGVLWVADSSNHRVLAYKPAASTSALKEFGHPAATAFTSNTPNDGGVSASSLYYPDGIGVDSSNRVWVADSQNDRVLIFKRAINQNGSPASVVLGQANFTTAGPNQNSSTVSAAGMSVPQGIVILGANGWVGDTNNNRTLQFTSPITNGMDATVVLGQPDFVSSAANQGNSGPSAPTQSSPFDAGPSLIALGVLGSLAAGRQWIHRLRHRP